MQVTIFGRADRKSDMKSYAELKINFIPNRMLVLSINVGGGRGGGGRGGAATAIITIVNMIFSP